MKQTDIEISYTAADTIPLKMLLNRNIVNNATSGVVIPVHLQLIPTNKCNRSCNFCSCSERDKTLELSFEKLKKIIDKCSKLGTKAVTITGGGEPLLYYKFEELINYLHSKNIKIGLVTNGMLLYQYKKETYDKITWCRISNGDDREFNDIYKNMLKKVIIECPDVDWAFSHVVSQKPNLNEIMKIIEFANENNFTHVRLVADLFEPQKVDIEEVHKQISTEVDDSKVIYQGRKEFTKGDDCYICYLKPVIGADGKLYTCCGAQYALKNVSRDLPKELCLGDAEDIDKVIASSSKPFDGSKCVKCYYSTYNKILKSMLSNINHKEFV